MVIVDRFDSNIYKNANMCVLGTSGAGKSFLVKLMIIRNRFMNIEQFVIDPDREYERVCKILDGSMIKIGGLSETYINIFDIRRNNIEDEAKGYLKDKIGRLNTFFSLVFTDMSKSEKVYLEEKIIECYKNKGITFDDSSLYMEYSKDDNICLKKNFKGAKDMPLLGDLYVILDKDNNTKRLAVELKPFIYGSLSFFNNYTNVDLNNKLIIADIHDLDEKILPIGMFLTADMFWDKIKENRSKKKIIYMDEVWRIIGSSGNTDAANFVYKIFKTIRKYGGGATAITQDVSDFFSLEDGKYGKAIVNNSALKIILQLEEEDVKILKNIINISEEEEIKIKSFERGVGLFFAGRNHTVVRVKAYDKEYNAITTDRKDLEILNLKR
jgi:type IV secretory pathway VirB4 component